MKLEDNAGSEAELLTAGQHQETGKPEIFPAVGKSTTAVYTL